MNTMLIFVPLSVSVGITIGFLYAPAKGTETRRTILYRCKKILAVSQPGNDEAPELH